MNIRQKENFFFTHAITILSLFTYSVYDERVKIVTVTVHRLENTIINNFRFFFVKFFFS